MRCIAVQIVKLAFFLLALIVSGVSRAEAEEEKILNVYIWNDYLDAQTVLEFSSQTGIKVNVDNYDSNQTLETKILSRQFGI